MNFFPVPPEEQGEVNRDVGYIFWKGKQWCVCEYGLQAIDRPYGMEFETIMNNTGRFSEEKSWSKKRKCLEETEAHLCAKSWVDEIDILWALSVIGGMFNDKGERNGLIPSSIASPEQIEQEALEASEREYNRVKKALSC